MIKYALFDIDNTLIDFGESAKIAMPRLFEVMGYPYTPEVPQLYHKFNAPLWAALERGEITGQYLRSIRWGRIMKALGIECDSVKMEAEYAEQLARVAVLVDGADELLKYLKEKGYVIAIASNSYQAQQERRTKLAGLDKYIDYYFTSMDMGVEKPSVEFFNRCFERLGNPSKDEMIMIGDSLTADVAGGKGAGITTIWFDKFKTHAENEADYAVTSLLDIKNIL
ncbi:MAG: YjjG family noncanonical pyrimidine nucleotidase [Oscillospiraceae bacterium]|nr:YjjG family noncanonical pyrimidine nucleotidase [Oscillospiraceae bacterium]